jgi:AcrR family transcriptional regulator
MSAGYIMATRQRQRTPREGEGGAPRRRGRPPVISTERLLAVAREVFLERGIRATTAEVAERAKVSEGVIFHRFSSKDALFRAAMQVDPDTLPDRLASIIETAEGRDLRTTMTEIAKRMLELGRVGVPVMMMSWSNPTGEYALETIGKRRPAFPRAFATVVAFFEREIERGRLAGCSPELLARIFMGSLHHYCMTELFEVPKESMRLSPDAFAKGVVDVLLLAAAREEDRPARRQPHRTARPRKTSP